MHISTRVRLTFNAIASRHGGCYLGVDRSGKVGITGQRLKGRGIQKQLGGRDPVGRPVHVPPEPDRMIRVHGTNWSVVNGLATVKADTDRLDSGSMDLDYYELEYRRSIVGAMLVNW
jgi:hypothetical protein